VLGEPRRGKPFENVAPEWAQGPYQCTFPCVRQSTRLFCFLVDCVVVWGFRVDSVSEEEVSLILDVVLLLFVG
jgi:hypothetical protein